ncbi:MAG: hypothetical protein DI539_09395 [Flavobacterium psychrophilum]|nr:MAG: hypothetical protein DI539_09395 [Flavobacterium psychrophilum]
MSTENLALLLSKHRFSQKGIHFITSSTEEGFLSYKELFHESTTVGTRLNNAGIQSGELAILQFEDNREFIVTFWACILKQIIPVPLAWAQNEESKRKLINVWKTSGFVRILTSPSLINRINNLTLEESEFTEDKYLQSLVAVDFSSSVDGSTGIEDKEAQPDDVAFVQFSSGSTGNPKGVMLTHKNVITNVLDIIKRSGLSEDDKLLNWMPLTHDMGLIGFHLTALSCGTSQFIIPTSVFIRNPMLWMSSANKHRITVTYSPNFGYQYFLLNYEDVRNSSWNLSSLRIIYNGAESISHLLCEKFHHHLKKYGLSETAILPAYGLAEASVALALSSPGGQLKCITLNRNKLDIGQKVIPDSNGATFVEIGTPLDSCQLLIVDNDGNELPSNTIGHIVAKGNNLSQGYLNNTTDTSNLYTSNLWLKTGDLGFISEGRLTVTGRFKNLLIHNGQNFYPADIERVLSVIPECDQGKVAVTDNGNSNGQDRIVVFVLYKGSISNFLPIATRVKEILLTHFGFSDTIVIPIKRIPKTTSGKVQHFKLREQYIHGFYETEQRQTEARLQVTVPPVSEYEISSKLTTIVRDVTGQHVPLDSSFFEIGLSSMQLFALSAKLKDSFGQGIAIVELFRNSSIRALSKIISSNNATPPAAIDNATNSRQYPVSPSQQRLWLINQLNSSPTFNVPILLEWSGKFDPIRFQDALNTLINRHEILRVSIINEDGRPFMFINDSKNDVIVCYHSNFLPETLQKAASITFDDLTGPLFRLDVYHISAEKVKILWNFHHIIIDGTSLVSLVKELLTVYHQPSSVSELQPRRYIDYSEWINDSFDRDWAIKSRKYWHALLRESNSFDLPVCFPRPKIRSQESGTWAIDFPARTYKGLKRLAANHQSTLFTSLFTLINTLLYRWTGLRDIITLTLVSGRPNETFGHTAGYFLNTLPIPLTIDPTKNIGELIDMAKTILTNSFEHQLYPFDWMVNDLGIPRQPGRTPFSDVVILFQDFGSGTEEEGTGDQKVRIDISQLDTGYSPSELFFELVHKPNSLSLNIKYEKSIITEDYAKNLAKHLVNLCDFYIEHEHTPVAEAEFLTTADLQLVSQLGNTQQNKPLSFLQRFYQNVERVGEHPAIVMNDRCLTYRMTDTISANIADMLINGYGAKENDRIALIMERSEITIACVVAIWKCGAVVVPIDPQSPGERVATIIEDCKPLAILSDGSHRSLRNGNIIDISSIDLSATTYPKKFPEFRNAEAYIIYTSGSSGKPKGVVVDHVNLAAMIDSWISEYQLHNFPVRLMQYANIAFDVFVGDICRGIATGGTIYVCPSEIRLLVHEMHKFIFNNEVNIFETTPAIGVPLMESITNDLRHINFIKLVILGSDVLSPAAFTDIRKRLPLSTRLINSYGTTETTIDASYFEYSEFLDRLTSTPIGKALPAARMYVLDENGLFLPPWMKGELCIGGDIVSRGYLNLATLTEAKFINHPQLQRIYKTGDFARWLPDGNIEFMGRNDNQVKVRGVRIELLEVQEIIKSYPSVLSSVVVATNDNLLAYFVASSQVSIQQLKSFLLERLPSVAVPYYYCQVNNIPITPNGKVAHELLPQPHLEPETEATLPKTELEFILSSIWKDILKTESLGTQSNFFELGGNSLRASEMIFRIQKELNVNLKLSTVFEAPTISDLAKSFEKLSIQPSYTSRKLIQSTSPLLPNQYQLWMFYILNGPTTTYNISGAIRLKGELKVNILEKAIQHTINNTPALRTAFVNGNPPLQVIKESIGDVFVRNGNYTDIYSTKFKLEEGYLWRFALDSVSDNEFILAYCFHHVVIDLWSSYVLLEMISKTYNQLLEGKSPEAYISYHHEETTPEDKDKNFWKDYLSNYEGLITLPEDRPRPSRKTYNGRSLNFALAENVAHKTISYAASQSSTVFSVLVTSFNILLSKYTGVKDISTGFPTTGRTSQEQASMVGYLTKVLPLRVLLRNDDTFNSLHLQCANRILECIKHEAYPLASIIEDMDMTWSPSSNPLFDVFLYIEDPIFEASDNVHFKNVTIDSVPVDAEGSKFDLSLLFKRKEKQLSVSIEFNTDLYEEKTIVDLFYRFQHLLNTLLSSPFRPVATIGIATPAEQQYLDSINTSFTLPLKSYIDQFQESVLTHEKSIALKHRSRCLTYGELNNRSSKVATYLTKQFNIGIDSKVVLLTDHSIESIIALMGIIKTGAAFIPIDHVNPLHRVQKIISSSHTDLVIHDEGLTVSEVSAVTLTDLTSQKTTDVLPPPQVTNETTAYILYTSGSTGQPKGVQVQWKSFNNYIHWCNRSYFANEKFDIPLFTSLGFDLTLTSIFPTFLRGATLHIYNSDSPALILNEIFGNASLDAVKLTPSHIEILKHLTVSQTTIKLAIVGGENLKTEHITVLRNLNPSIRILNEYGPTEATVGCTTKEILNENDIITIGRPIQNAEIFILDDDKNLCPPSVKGEIYIGGTCLSAGYINQPQQTNALFSIDNDLKKLLYKSGDGGWWTSDGEIVCIGRKDNMVKISGYRVETDEVTTSINQLKEIDNAIAIAQHVNGEQVLIAYCVVNGDTTLRELKDRLSQKLPSYMIPTYFVLMDKLPLTSNGKIDAKRLKLPNVMTPEKNHPGSHLEQEIMKTWIALLNFDEISLNDNFFQLGGNSLLVIKLHDVLSKAYPGKINIADLFTHHTIEKQAALIASNSIETAPPVIKEIEF